MEATLARSVIGQDEALAVVSNAVRVSRAGLQSSERPLGAPLLAPSCWSGRPAWARRASARFLFDSADAVTRLDMSEFSEKHAVSRLVGAPPGYVGYDEGGQLTEAVRRRPYSVLLLDEFEKAHREVATLLLQTVDFRNTIIIMTSNLGAEAARVAAGGGRLLQGAARSAQGDRGRLPARVLFERLTRERIAAICAVEVQLRERLSARGVRLRLSPDALLRLAEAGYDPAYGARPVRRAIRHHLLDPLSRLLIGDQEAQDGATVLVDTKDTGAGAGGGAAQPSIVPPLPGVPFATGLFGAGGAAAAVPPSDMAAAVRIRLLAPGAPLPPEDTGVDWDEGPESAA
ncbi:Hsp104 [Emiliania huxleyi CCMP1516]|uniref:Clp ATPase C-terminal domain-containing protein n=2 Tax=Emiliania huxleyi TaxID=2903 RepID=A0A0D3KL67_EMIH1|nr:Hsp104 [Emiliania huxleyi CCMP1516]EOD36502.1 Hsp104 [Emiliania huxleyi CCMP1516]|eukprot:XP_005788931.1 Hsp104 [Emiliania huxleyi CCMP1516]